MFRYTLLSVGEHIHPDGVPDRQWVCDSPAYTRCLHTNYSITIRTQSSGVYVMQQQNGREFGECCLRIWHALTDVPNREVPRITYRELAQATRLPFGHFIGRGLGSEWLDSVYDLCIDRGLPPLPVLVVLARHGYPSSGYVPVDSVREDTEQVRGKDWSQLSTPEVCDFKRRNY